MSDETNVALGDGTSGPATPVLRIHTQHAVLEEIAAHTTSDTSVEQGGVLVGEIDETTGTLLVYGSVRADGAEATNSSLTFTHEAWDHISSVMERDWPGARIVGWYHSHPSFGIFLSEFDRFICDNFFSEPWQVAYVHDPIAGDDGFFARRDGTLARVADWDVCTRMDAPRPERNVADPVHRIEPVTPVHARDTQSVNPILTGIAGLVIGAIVFGLLLRSDPDRVVFAAPNVPDTALFVDAGSVALGRDGAVYAGEPGVVRSANGNGTRPVARVEGARVPPVAVLEDGSLIYADPAQAQLHRVTGSATRPVTVPDTELAWSTITTIAATGDTLWVLDGPAGTVHKVTVGEPGEPVIVNDPISVGVPTATGIAADGDDVWILDPVAGRIYELDGSATTPFAGGGEQRWDTEGVSARDVDLTGAVSITAIDGGVYVTIDTTPAPAGADPDGPDTDGGIGDVPPAAGAMLVIRDDRVLSVAQLDCSGPVTSAITSTGPVVVFVDACTGRAGSLTVTDGPSATTTPSTTAPASTTPTSAPEGADEDRPVEPTSTTAP